MIRRYNFFRKNICFVIFLCVMSILSVAHASVVLGGTRLIYNAKDSEANLRLSNVDNSPSLVQVWIDDGNQNANPSDIDVPFIVTPSLARIDQNKGQTLRIFRSGEALAQDKESVFWLNVLEIPPESDSAKNDVNEVNIVFRSRIKLFYRPEGLIGKPEETPAKIVWRLEERQGKTVVIANNPTPYHFSYASIDVVSGGKKISSSQGGMISPHESAIITLDGVIPDHKNAVVYYHSINDYGAQQDGQEKVSQ